MKNILILLAIISGTFTMSVNAQTMIENTTRTKKGTIEQEDVKWESNILNNGLNPVSYRVVIDTTGLNPLHEFYFCWDNCYGPGQTNSLNFGQEIPSNGSFLFSLHLVGPIDEDFNYTKLPEGDSRLCAKFINVNNPSDVFDICIDYRIGLLTSVKEAEDQIATISPNPTSSNSIVRYTLPSSISTAKLTLYSVTGTKVLEKVLDRSGAVTLESSTLEQGAYYYLISTPNQILQKSSFQVVR
jgi:hypothetical protein